MKNGYAEYANLSTLAIHYKRLNNGKYAVIGFYKPHSKYFGIVCNNLEYGLTVIRDIYNRKYDYTVLNSNINYN